MKLIPVAHELISGMRDFFLSTNTAYSKEEPLRAELFSSSQMQKFAVTLARSHKLNKNATEDHLLKRLDDNENILHKVRKLIADAIKRKQQITPASEWLIDNFYLVEENIRTAKKNFPKGYSENLPQLLIHDSDSITRIYDIVLQIIMHTDGRIDIENLSGFINAYQSVTNLQLGELWAIPIMLRLALIENLRRVSSQIAIDGVDRNLANYWAQQLIETSEKDSKNLILVIADMARSNPPMGGAFVSELTRLIAGKGADLAIALAWIERQLSDSGITAAELVRAENQKQAADQVSMSNSIGSLRMLGVMDWKEFVESHSIVEQTLREDPAGIYGKMDFTTRDSYRHIVEYIAKYSTFSEYKVAQFAIQLSLKKCEIKGDEERARHVGYFLVGAGVRETKKMAKMNEPLTVKLRQSVNRYAFRMYFTFIFIITLVLSEAIVFRAAMDTENPWLLSIIGCIALICSSQLAISLVNFIATLFVKPDLLPRMNFANQIPDDCQTMVVIPALISDDNEIENLVEDLEVRFLANRNEHIYFALLTDFMDAPKETMPEDASHLTLLQKRILQLNIKYGRTKNDLFYLFHRQRKWNPKQNVWMGYERKRGKIAELNALLRGVTKFGFSTIIGDPGVFPHIKYVITLDADTQLPLGTAWKMIGTMAHPLNHPWYDPDKKRVTKGYGILQPRVAVSLPDKMSSLYTKMHGNEPGIDPYTRASSDVYQDVFQEGSFIGKGIYEVDTFLHVLEGKFSENIILSHDLLEGCYVRSGLLSDVQLFEKYPKSYSADMKRFTRWIRGDWQIFGWFFPFVRNNKHKLIRNPLSALSKWKIFDNIRRSLVPVALVVFLLLAWTSLPSSIYWTIFATLIILLPIVITTIWDTLKKPKEIIFSHHVKNSIQNITEISIKTFLILICLPYEAFANLSAILLTLWRMLITRKKLLTWNTSHHVERYSRPGIIAYYFLMWIEPFLVTTVFIYLFFYTPLETRVAGPILAVWFLAPFITWWISKPPGKKIASLSDHQIGFLRQMARKTYGYFEQFVNEGDNFLPPDNFQEQPVVEIAHRTSPTNIGLALLSDLTAYDFGYIPAGRLLNRVENTMQAMHRMERFRGHFYNWYDTLTLQPLLPKYISTVDSGNLVGHLMILKQGLLGLPQQPVINKNIFEGLRDTLLILKALTDHDHVHLLNKMEDQLKIAIADELYSVDKMKYHFDLLHSCFQTIKSKMELKPESDAGWWLHALHNQIESIGNEFKIFAPWFLPLELPDIFTEIRAPSSFINLHDLLKLALELKKTSLPETDPNNQEQSSRLVAFHEAIEHTIDLIENRLEKIQALSKSCNDFTNVDWDFLFNKASKLFSIGYNVQDHVMDASYYDLLASEARFCVFIAIAQGKLPEDSWFALGRMLTKTDHDPILLSWSGSMFEYLMPLLVMPSYENTLLDQTYNAVVKWQINYGKRLALPWGISESGYNMINAVSHYQYRAFGAPGLGLKRGLEEDTVITPYASALALMVMPKSASKNLRMLAEKEMTGRYGFYEAIDYTVSRLQRGQSSAIVYSFMAHHQGMTMLSIAYALLDKPMQKRFDAEPQLKSVNLLLQERIPRATAFYAHTTDIPEITSPSGEAEIRIVKTPNTILPEIQLLSNGRYHVMITNSGAGYSRWKEFAVTRWREDATCDNWGTFCYVRDLKLQKFWSTTYQPVLIKPDAYEVAYSQGRVDFRTRHFDIETRTEIVISPEDDIEMRRLVITNHSDSTRIIEITSYAEVVIAVPASDLMQPAFNNLFVQTEIIPQQHAIICTRRKRSAEEQPPWMFHLLTMHGKNPEELSYETDRMQFMGRDNSIANPLAMQKAGPLSGTQGSVLDPVIAIRCKLILEPDEIVTLDMVTGIAETKEICNALIGKYQDKHHKDRVYELSWTHSQVLLRQINASESDAQLFTRLAGSVIFMNPAFRADPSILISNHRKQSGLWGYAISGDLPIVLLKIENQENLLLVKQMIQAHAYWKLKGLPVDLVIWNEDHGGYRQVFQNEIEALIPTELKDKPGGIFVRASDQISNEDRILFQTVARINIADNIESFAEHVKRKPSPRINIPRLVPEKDYKPEFTSLSLPDDLIYFNGTGGFSKNGREYIIGIHKKLKTPAPWVNVIANPNFGTVISASGSAYTWTENAHELRLTPWSNDPVSDPGGEVFYLRDSETGHFWSATLLPAGGESLYITKHGLGYSIFEHSEDGIYSELKIFTDIEAPVKFIILKVRNQSGRSRKLSATGYIEWVLDNNRTKTGMHIHTELDPESGALFAKNTYNTEFNNRVAFFDTDSIKKTYTGDRNEFIGRNGNLQNPEALYRTKLSGKVGLALDPCGALQVSFDLGENEEQEIIFRLGAGKDAPDASALVKKFRGSEVAHEAFELIKKFWMQATGAIQIETPDPAINLITNGWLTYQIISSRLWGRSGFYQSGGAFGFRDQLQDVLALMHTDPQFARNQILLCASRQFKEGDVQHWWHPPAGNGVRTRCSDDYLWLPYATAQYISFTNDAGILDETTTYLEGRPLNANEETYYDTPVQSIISGKIYEHCTLAIKHGLRFGEHSLPLIGTGDWNDGFDKVGKDGKGESVWMAFFLYDILQRFEIIATGYNDSDFARLCETEAKKLKENIARHAWDGEWFKRAWFDNGAQLGSAKNMECKIDSISQSWAVLSDATDDTRKQKALESAYKHLVQKETGIIRLLEPPFDKSELNPGYIKGYVPGIRENGGQYTHAAIWMIMAFAKMGDHKKVWELLQMINPIKHGDTEELISIYKTEPYVLAADVYAGNQHAGRGGWTWYTGSAGWMYRLITESFLGLQREGNKLKFNPCIPKEWDSFKIHYRYINTIYHITFIQKKESGEMQVKEFDVIQENQMITLADDGAEHEIRVEIFSTPVL